jgi:hypothetical protein
VRSATWWNRRGRHDRAGGWAVFEFPSELDHEVAAIEY